MKLKVDDAIKSLDYDDLVRLNEDLREGGHSTRALVEKRIVEKEKEHGRFCQVCQCEIDPHSTQNYTILFGPEGLKRRASFCALDCLKYFIAAIEKRREKAKKVRSGD